MSRTFSVPAHASGQNVSQVWWAGPLWVRLAERDGASWLVVGLGPRLDDLVRWGVGAGVECERIVDWVEATGMCRWEVRLTEVVDRFLVELVDVIADVRRATGMVQLELEGLEEGDGGDVASGGVER